MEKSYEEPEVGSLWIDADEGMDRIYQYMGMAQKEPCKGQMHFAFYDWKTKTAESEGGAWVGANRLKSDFRPVHRLKKKPCCDLPTVYPELWCDDCGYEAWDKARENAA